MKSGWVIEAMGVISEMDHADAVYCDEHIWVGNEEVEAWFYPDGTCIVSRGDELRKMQTKEAGPELAPQPPEGFFSASAVG